MGPWLFDLSAVSAGGCQPCALSPAPSWHGFALSLLMDISLMTLLKRFFLFFVCFRLFPQTKQGAPHVSKTFDL